MQIEIITKKTKEVELPFFFKSESGIHYAILKEDLGIAIYSPDLSITKYPDIYLKNFTDTATKITAEEFTKRYDEVLEVFQSIKLLFFTNNNQ